MLFQENLSRPQFFNFGIVKRAAGGQDIGRIIDISRQVFRTDAIDIISSHLHGIARLVVFVFGQIVIFINTIIHLADGIIMCLTKNCIAYRRIVERVGVIIHYSACFDNSALRIERIYCKDIFISVHSVFIYVPGIILTTVFIIM